jgi:hypothetical protein
MERAVTQSFGAKLKAKDGRRPRGQMLAEWDPTPSCLTEVSGRVKFGDILEA